MEPGSPALQADSLSAELLRKLLGKPICMYVCVCVCIYIYIYSERGKRGVERHILQESDLCTM